jgi:flagellar basal body rod protein FlgG
LAEEMKKYKVDDEGYIIGEDGKRILDENGNPMKPEDLILNSSSGGSI